MELYNLYYGVVSALGLCHVPYAKSLYFGVLIAVLIWTGLFVLQGVGLCLMAKKQNVSKRWRAFVPFANLLLIGKLAGEANFFGNKVKRAGLYAMLAQIFTTLFCFAEIFAVLYLSTVKGLPTFDDLGRPYWSNVEGFSYAMTVLLNVCTMFSPILQMIYEVLIFIIVLALYKKYVPSSYFGLGVLTLFIPLARYITVFAIRNRDVVDYETYMRAKYAEYMQQRGYTSYGGSTHPSSPSNGYGSAEEVRAERQADPFEEFSEEKKDED